MPQVGEAIARADKAANGGGNVLFYLATPPEFFAPIVTQLGEAGLVREEGDDWRRVIVEKPFGHDLASAVALNKELAKTLTESQIYRIDHYLGQGDRPEPDGLPLRERHLRAGVEPALRRSVQITVAETVGVEGAAATTRRPARCATWCRTICSRCSR